MQKHKLDAIAEVKIIITPKHSDNNLLQYDRTITIRREDVTTTVGAFRATRDTLRDEVDNLFDNLREFTPPADYF